MRSMLCAAAAAAALLACAVPAHAATFVVDTTADATDVLPGDGLCASAAFGCSLRAAIQEASALDGADSIVLPAGTYTLTLAGDEEDAGATGDLDVVLGDLTITGAGADSTVIDAAGIDRVLHVSPSSVNAAETSLTLSGVTVRGGRTPWFGGGIAAQGTLTLDRVDVVDNAATDEGGGSGGGIYVQGELTIDDSTISGNATGGAGGGGIFLRFGPASIARTTISGNSVVASGGGGIYNWAFYGLTVADSTISGNSVENDGGGGIYNRGPLTLTGSTVSGNSEGSGGGGGGIWNGGQTATIENSTISGNSTDGAGGGIYGGTLTLTSSTVTGNSGAGSGGVGGIYVGTATAKNSIVAENVNGECSRAFPSTAGHNLESGASCGFDLQNASPMLGPLAANGGLTLTHALLAGSPAIDAGADCPPPATDQRGIARPAGSACDLGAYEGGTAASGPRVTISAPATAAPGDVTLTVDVTLHDDTPAAIDGVTVRIATGGGLGLAGGASSTMAVGTLGAGATAPVSFELAAAAACADRTGTYSVFVDWTGNTGAEVEYARTVALAGTCGRVAGTVSALGYGTLASAEVDACPASGGGCSVVTTDGSGAYLISGLAPGAYALTAHPPIPSPDPVLVPLTLAIAVSEGATTTQNLTLSVRAPVPSGVSLPDGHVSSTGVARMSEAGSRLVVPGCAGGLAAGWELRRRDGTLVEGGPLEEGPAGTYTGTIVPDEHGWLELTWTIDCPGAAPDDGGGFDVYVDPSGYVYDAVGAPVVGATVTLFRADADTGPWTQVPDGSELMSPANRTNPDLSDSTGHYGWDVVAGFYKVVASKSGCTVESSVVQVPPPVTDLDIVLACLNAPAGGGSPGGGGASDDGDEDGDGGGGGGEARPSGGGGGGGGAAPASTPPVAIPPKAAPAPAPVAVAAPVLRLSAGKATIRRSRGMALVRTTIAATADAPLRLSVLRGRRVVPIRPQSRLGGVRVGRSHRVVVLHAHAGRTPITLRLRARDLRGGAAILRVTGPGVSLRLRLPR